MIRRPSKERFTAWQTRSEHSTDRPTKIALLAAVTMDPARREELTRLAFEPLEASRDEGWNFLYDPNTERENISLGYYRLGDFEEPEYLLEYYTPLRALDLPWTDERLREIESGKAKPNDNELHQ